MSRNPRASGLTEKYYDNCRKNPAVFYFQKSVDIQEYYCIIVLGT